MTDKNNDDLCLVAGPLLPPRPGISYLDHQEIGVRWMMARELPDAPVCRGGILGDDMGLGKTFQTIGLLLNGLELSTLLVCPPALIAGWTEELSACGFSVRTLMAGCSTWSPAAVGQEDRVPVFLTTYPKATMYRHALTEQAFARVILDEGHAIRNGKGTTRGYAADCYSKGAICRWILSATPVQNSYSDWRNLCLWLRVSCGSSQIPDLGPLLMLRRTMDELRPVMSALPPPPRFVVHDLHIPGRGATAAEARLFRALCDQLQSAIDSPAVSALMRLELYIRIQQFLVHPQIYIESMRNKFRGAYPRPDWTGTATKWSACVAELERGIRDRCGTIVFCQFRAEIDRVAAAAGAAGAEVFTIRGGMDPEEIGEAVVAGRRAVDAGLPVVVVVQIVSGGAGLNLQFCSRILFLSQHWNPAVVHQAIGRAVRIGARGRAEIHLFRVVDDVFDNLDRRMIAAHGRKIQGARDVCGSLYEGYAPLDEEAFEEAAAAAEKDVAVAVLTCAPAVAEERLTPGIRTSTSSASPDEDPS
jgi:hypothetical protein